MNKIKTYFFPPIKSLFLIFLFVLLFLKINDTKFLLFGCAFGLFLFLLIIIPESYTFIYDNKKLYVRNRINFLYYREVEFKDISRIEIGHETFVGTSLIIILNNNKKHVFPSNFINNSHKVFINFFNSQNKESD